MFRSNPFTVCGFDQSPGELVNFGGFECCFMV